MHDSRQVAALCAAALLMVTASAPAATIDVSQLHLTWSDEFNGSVLDTTYWQAPNEVRQGHSRWTPSQVSVSGGSLRLGIHRVDDPVIKYECGGVRTQKDYNPGQTMFQQKFGYFEARCKMPAQIGADYWAAFWMMAGTVNSSTPDTRQGTEIDIMESFTYNKPGQHVMAFHWNGYGAAHNSTSLQCGPQPQVLDGGFHTYGLWWDENWYVGYVDGIEVGRTNMIGLGSSGPGKALSQGTALQPAYLLLSCEAALWPGTDWQNWDPVMPAEDEFLVDYVRAYAVPEPAVALAAGVAGFLALRRPRH